MNSNYDRLCRRRHEWVLWIFYIGLCLAMLRRENKIIDLNMFTATTKEIKNIERENSTSIVPLTLKRIFDTLTITLIVAMLPIQNPCNANLNYFFTQNITLTRMRTL